MGVIKVSAVTWGVFDERESKTCMDREKVNPAYFIRSGDFLFSRANTISLVGACVIVPSVSRTLMLSDKILRLVFRQPSLQPWVLLALRNREGRSQIESLATGNQESMRNIGQAKIRQIEILVAPLDEQRRIVAEIEKQFTRLDEAVATLEGVRAKLKRARASVLKTAVEGRLVPTEVELARAEGHSYEPASVLLSRIAAERGRGFPPPVGDPGDLPPLPEGWCWSTVEAVGDVLLGRQRAPQYLTGKHPKPYLRVANIKDDYIDFSDVEEMDFDTVHAAKYSLRPGDILVSEGQSPELVGQSAIFRSGPAGLCFQKTLHRFRPVDSGPSAEFAQVVFRAHVRTGVFTRVASITTNIAHLTLEKFKATPFPLPPAGEQARIVAEVERRLGVLSAIERTVESNLARCRRLRQSILKRAFEGKLVPQDPRDEPASELLARIKAARPGETRA